MHNQVKLHTLSRLKISFQFNFEYNCYENIFALFDSNFTILLHTKINKFFYIFNKSAKKLDDDSLSAKANPTDDKWAKQWAIIGTNFGQLPCHDSASPGPNMFNTLRLRQNGHHFADDTFKCFFLNSCIGSEKGLVLTRHQAIIWTNDRLPTHICVTQPQWVNITPKPR